MKPSDKTDVLAATQPYEPPRIESVMTADELAREIQYAGVEFVTALDFA